MKLITTKLSLFALTLSLTQLSFANDTRTLKCSFTEPFYHLELNLYSGKLVKIEWDWQDSDPNSDWIQTVIEEASEVSLLPSERTLFFTSINHNQLLLEGVLSYQGSDGMSDNFYPFEVIHHDVVRGTHHGGCQLNTLESYDPSILEEPTLEFAENATDAIALCFNRAISNWTLDASAYLPTQTKFYTLYQSEVVPGEPGNVSETFSSAENAALYETLMTTKTPPEGEEVASIVRNGMWNYCLQYASYLQNRF